METTFITIHDLTAEARILYSSESIVDILGYAPSEVANRSCWEFFHPDEIPVAQAAHGRGIDLDKAAVLSYCRMKNKEGHWLGCEVVFTIVHDVMVGCTSVYRRGSKSQKRATEAPMIRRLFSNSPKDPRYHMLSHLSSKFLSPSKVETHEPRAALFLNRFTRTLTIMYATEGLSEVLGISGAELMGRSFYFCIQETCLKDAVKCLENAKANDSIAYLRFWFRNPNQEQENEQNSWTENRMDVDGDPEDIRSSDGDQDMGGVEFQNHLRDPTRNRNNQRANNQAVFSSSSVEPSDGPVYNNGSHLHPDDSRASSGESSNAYTHEAVFGEPAHRSSSASSVSNSPLDDRRPFNNGYPRSTKEPIELEAVVSCTSDGLVVCLRQAHTPLPAQQASEQTRSMYNRGLFAVPWSPEPILPPVEQRLHYASPPGYIPHVDTAPSVQSQATQQLKPGNDDFMSSIRDIAVFAWALVGINGSLAEYGRGKPCGEAQPPAGLPVWQPEDTQHKASGFRDAYRPGQEEDNSSRNLLNGHRLGNAGQPLSNPAPPMNFSMPRTYTPAHPNGHSNGWNQQ